MSKTTTDNWHQPVLDTSIEGFIEHGFQRFVISVTYQSELIENYFQDGRQWDVSIEYLREKEALGTAGSLGLLNDRLRFALEHPIIVMNGDLLTKLNYRSLLEFHEDHEAPITMCVRDYDFQVPYGVVKLDNSYATALEKSQCISFSSMQEFMSLVQKLFHQFLKIISKI